MAKISLFKNIKRGKGVIENPNYDSKARDSFIAMENAKKAGFDVPTSNKTEKYFKDFKKWMKDYDNWKTISVPKNVERAKEYFAQEKLYKEYEDKYELLFGMARDENEKIKDKVTELIRVDPEMERLRKKYKTAKKISDISDIKRALYARMEEIKKENPTIDVPNFTTWAKENGLPEELEYGVNGKKYLRENEMEHRPSTPKYSVMMRPSNQEFIKRYHTTNIKNLPSILENGLEPRKGGGYMNNLPVGHPGRVKGVFTESRGPFTNGPRYEPYGAMESVKLEMDIPKKEYVTNERLPFNPETQSNQSLKFKVPHRNQLNTIQTGGRTDIFTKKIEPKNIKKIWLEGDYDVIGFTPQEFAFDKDACNNYGKVCEDAQIAIQDWLSRMGKK